MNCYTDRPKEQCCSLVNVTDLFMQHTNLVISKYHYVQPDLNLPEHQKYDIERGL